MKTKLPFALAVLCLAFLILPACASPVIWLHTSGTKIYSEDNTEVIFNGVSTMTVLGYEPPSYDSPIYSESDIAEVRSHGLNLIRLDIGMSSSLYNVSYTSQTPTNLTFDSRFFPYIDALVAEAASQGLWVNLCFAMNAQAPLAGWRGITETGQGIGFPTWMYNGSWAYFNKTYTANQTGLDEAIFDFWNTSNPTAANVRTSYQTWWVTMANHYATMPNVIFGLWNEPLVEKDAIPWTNQTEGAEMIRDFMQDTIDLIRAEAANNLIFVNAAFLWDLWTNLKIDRANIVNEAHGYNGTNYIDFEDPTAFRGATYPSYWDYGWRYIQPFIMGELGGIEEGTLQSKTQTIATLENLTDAGVSWSYLSFRPYGESWNPSSDTWTTVLEPNLIPNIVYYNSSYAYTLELNIISPLNQVYTSPSISVSLSTSGNDTALSYSWNILKSDSTWLYVSNQTGTTATATINYNGTSTFCCYVSGQHLTEDYEETPFITYIITEEPSPPVTPETEMPSNYEPVDLGAMPMILIFAIVSFVALGFYIKMRTG